MAFPTIQGDLPFPSQNSAASQMFQGLGGSPQQAFQSLGSSYAGSYNNALAMNQANYANILKGYQDTLAGQTSAQQAIQSGYTDLYNNVLGSIAGVGQSQQTAINDQYARATGALSQQLTDRGLGNTTVAPNLQRGVEADRAKASNDLAGTIAQLRASYMSQLGQAGLGFGERAYGQNAALAQNQLGFMNSVNSPYPDAGLYSQLAQQYGAVGEADKDRAQFAAQQQQLQQAARGGGGIVATPVVGGAVGGGGSSGGILSQAPMQGVGGPALYGAGGGQAPSAMFRPSATGTDFGAGTTGINPAGALFGGAGLGAAYAGGLTPTPQDDGELTPWMANVVASSYGLEGAQLPGVEDLGINLGTLSGLGGFGGL
jgi:hypothetical protein